MNSAAGKAPPGPPPKPAPTGDFGLAAARQWSTGLLAQIRARLAALPELADAFVSISVGGSLARLEAGAASDFDGVFVAREDARPGTQDAAIAAVFAALADLPLRLPKATGIYRSSVTRQQLLSPSARGSLDEPPAVFGKRMHCLIDACPVYRDPACSAVQHAVLDWYLLAPGRAAEPPSTTHLKRDLLRYLHAYAGWQQFDYGRSADDGWALRQIKLRTTRMIGFAGLLFLIGESASHADCRAWLRTHLPLTPLERVERVMRTHDNDAYERLHAAYARATYHIRDAASRQHLVTISPMHPAAPPPDQDLPWREAWAQSGIVLDELNNFLLDRRATWGGRFFTHLVF